jgi:hypothetical protein
MCPYCGSIEIKGNQCKWCHSKIPYEKIKSIRLNNKEFYKNKGGSEND